MRLKREGSDVVVAGAGVAGLSAALAAADAGASVLVLAKASHTSSNSYAAQGGVAAAVGPGDDPALHAADTLVAGRGLCRASAVRLLTEEAPTRIAELRRLGVAFDDGLGREGGHSHARVVHAGGADTGRHIADVLTQRRPRASPDPARRGRADHHARRLPPLRRSARDRRLRGPLGPHHEPGRRRGRRPPARAGCGRRPGRPRARPVPPDRAAGRERPRRLPAFRGAPRCRRDAARRRRRALRRRARAARRGRARGRSALGSAPRPAPGRARPLSEPDGDAGGGGLRPRRRAGARLPRRALRDRRRRLGSRRPHVGAGALRGGRVCVHGRARREPTRVELAARVPRLRSPRRTRRARPVRFSMRKPLRSPPPRIRVRHSGATPG